MNEIKNNFAKGFAVIHTTMDVVEERSIESEDEELECLEFADKLEGGMQMYSDSGRFSMGYSLVGSTLRHDDSFYDNNFIDISTINEEMLSKRVVKYFQKYWWLVYPEGKFKLVWDYLIGLIIVGLVHSDLRCVRAACQV